MINKRGQLKVADFGIARSLADSVSRLTKEPRHTSGTLVYMSPQQLDGERGSHLDDIYSLGATIYELLTSKPPFYSGNIDRQIHDRVPPPMMQRRKDLAIEGGAIPRTWEEIVSSCLAKEPTRRPQSVTEVGRQLAGSAPKIRRTAKAFPRSSKQTTVIVASASLCVAAVPRIVPRKLQAAATARCCTRCESQYFATGCNRYTRWPWRAEDACNYQCEPGEVFIVGRARRLQAFRPTDRN